MLQVYGFIHNAVLSNVKEETKCNFCKKKNEMRLSHLLIWLNLLILDTFLLEGMTFFQDLLKIINAWYCAMKLS